MGSVLRWAFYGVFFSILPLVVTWMFVPKAVSFDELLGRGELAVLAIALAGTSMAAVWEGRKCREFLVGLNVVFLVLATLLLIAVVVKAEKVSPHVAVIFSTWLLVVTILVGLVCNWRPNRSEENGK